MITCTSVSGSSEWYQRVLGLTSAHGGDEYEMLMSGDSLVLQLHEIDPHHHPALLRDGEPAGGNGVALWFDTSSFDIDVARIHAARDSNGIEVEIVEDVHVNPSAQHREIWFRDLDGYLVVLSSPHGDVD